MDNREEENEANEALASFMEADAAELRAGRPAPPALPDPCPPEGVTCLRMCREAMQMVERLEDSGEPVQDKELGKKMRALYREQLVPIVDFYIRSLS